jgi:hypothetical protein
VRAERSKFSGRFLSPCESENHADVHAQGGWAEKYVSSDITALKPGSSLIFLCARISLRTTHKLMHAQQGWRLIENTGYEVNEKAHRSISLKCG